MSSHVSVYRAGVALLFAVTVLTGCTGSPNPSPATPSPGEPPTDPPPPAEVASVPATVVIGGGGVSIRGDDGSVLQELSFTEDSQTAIDMLGEVFGDAPAVEDTVGGECVFPETTASWGEDGFVIAHGPELPLPEGLQFHVSSQSAVVGEIAIRTPTGFTVGDSLDDLVRATPGAEIEAIEFEGVVYALVKYEIEDTGDAEWGAFAWAEDDVIQGLAGGYFLDGDC